jgi:anti-sigma factor RsiW
VLTCREFVEFLDAYLAGQLPPDVRARFDQHLAACPSCIVYTQTYRATIRLARQTFESDAPVAGVPEELVDAILRARDHSRAS